MVYVQQRRKAQPGQVLFYSVPGVAAVDGNNDPADRLARAMKRLSEWLKFAKQDKASLAEVCILAFFVTLAILVVIYALRVGDIDLSCRGIICR